MIRSNTNTPLGQILKILTYQIKPRHISPSRVVVRRYFIHYYARVKTVDFVMVKAMSLSDRVRTTVSIASSAELSHL